MNRSSKGWRVLAGSTIFITAAVTLQTAAAPTVVGRSNIPAVFNPFNPAIRVSASPAVILIGQEPVVVRVLPVRTPFRPPVRSPFKP